MGSHNGPSSQPTVALPPMIGRAVRLLREEQGIDAEELADGAGLPCEVVEDLEAGRLEPDPQLLEEVADGLGTAPSALISLAEQLSS
jgi:transcriptional regulator with XRE-family HTH domain